VVTVLFCDVVGSTEAASGMDPERWQEIINGALQRMIDPIYRYGGVVARLMGDGLLAFFGAPVAHEDDPERAIRAGLDIVADLGGGGEHGLMGRVGINTGLVLVGEVGTDQMAEYTAMGTAVNVAARMEQTAEPGTVHVAESTRLAAGDRFEWEDLGEVTLKGVSAPVRAFRPLGVPSDSHSDGGRLFVGRDRELRTVSDAIGRLEGGGIGSVVLLGGEAGIGKTRLIAEARKARGTSAWVRVGAASYESEVPFAFARRLVDAFGRVDGIDIGSEGAVVVLTDPEGREGDHQGLATSLAFAIGTAVGSADTPVVFECDDIHWCDAPSLEVLGELAAFSRTDRVALICGFRAEPGSHVSVFARSVQDELPDVATSIDLRPLADEDMRVLLGELAPHLSASAMDAWVPRLGGNPLFAEESVASMAGEGASELPANLMGLLTAQLDRLPAGARRAAQFASVLGEAFDASMLDASDGAIDLQPLLRARVLVEVARLPERRLAFRVPLMREAAYATIPLRDRARFHRRVAEALEAAGEASPELLARHFRLSEDPRAVSYEITAGARAQRLSAHAEAIALLERANEDVTSGVAEVDADARTTLGTSLGRALELGGRHEDAREVYEQLLSWAEANAEPSAELAALVRLGLIHSRTSPLLDPPVGWEYTRRGLDLARSLGETAQEARLEWVAGHLESDVFGRVEHFSRARDLFEASDDQDGFAFVLMDLGRVLAMVSRRNEAHEAIDRAHEMWDAMGNKAMKADSFFAMGFLEFNFGSTEAARRHYEDARVLAEEISSTWLLEFTSIMFALTDLREGRLSSWWEAASPYLSLDSVGMPGFFSLLSITDGCMSLGLYDELLAFLEVTLRSAAARLDPWKADMLMARALALLALGDRPGAEEAYAEAEELDPDWSTPLQSNVSQRATAFLIRCNLLDGNVGGAMEALARYDRWAAVHGNLAERADGVALRAEVEEAAGEQSVDRYLEAAARYAEASSWKESVMRFQAARVSGDDEDMDAARTSARAFLEGLPEEATRAVGDFPWFASD
jgi:class 3 adenylate cyclase/tetratricopeptide (TPR) repeat protein